MRRLLPLLSLAACQPDEVSDAILWAAATAPEWIVPSDDLPVTTQDANNNLAMTEHEGSLFLAFRTAPDHFADPKAQLHVLRSDDDGVTWAHELTVALGTDVREPQLLSFGGTLRLWYAELGTSSLDFEPHGTWTRVRLGPGQWSEPEAFGTEGLIPWRIKVLQGRASLLGYVGGENVYDLGGEPIQVVWWGSDDGATWEPWVPGHEVVHEGGASEADLAFLPDGGIVAVLRNEAGDDHGFGSLICRASADALGDWECASDPRKYDSPLVFRAMDRTWLVGRRNLTEDGAYDLGGDGDRRQQYLRNQFAYWQEGKRCSLWRVEPDTLTVHWVLDLPSKGDTCFPDGRALDAGRWEIWNYSSPLEGGEPGWQEAQLEPTGIYRTRVGFWFDAPPE